MLFGQCADTVTWRGVLRFNTVVNPLASSTGRSAQQLHNPMQQHHLLSCAVQGEAVAEVASIWNCKNSVAKTVLMHYMWDKDKLMSECTACRLQNKRQPLTAAKPGVQSPVCSCRPVSCTCSCTATHALRFVTCTLPCLVVQACPAFLLTVRTGSAANVQASLGCVASGVCPACPALVAHFLQATLLTEGQSGCSREQALQCPVTVMLALVSGSRVGEVLLHHAALVSRPPLLRPCLCDVVRVGWLGTNMDLPACPLMPCDESLGMQAHGDRSA